MNTFRSSCPCIISGARSKGLVHRFLSLRKPTRTPTRSGRCSNCGTARQREGQVLETTPEEIEPLQQRTNPQRDVRGFDSDDVACRLSVILMVAHCNTSLEHDEEIDLAERVYTQLKMEGSPLVDRRWENNPSRLPDFVFQHFHSVVKEQLGKSYTRPLGDQVPSFF
ncbi:hypothetical protein F5Y11DRAFT_166924 [Daldinia sp. FL1419]|nr:hypothetical protein F5Y11DRAFT_166924 [Daldinia sp. FL1419]